MSLSSFLFLLHQKKRFDAIHRLLLKTRKLTAESLLNACTRDILLRLLQCAGTSTRHAFLEFILKPI